MRPADRVTEVAIKVDVDTHVGAREGIPRLASIFRAAGIPASFFVSMGPDRSGRAILRVLTRKGFLRKMLRTRAASTYGLRTILSGTLLPSRPVGSAFPHLLRSLDEEGHEVGPHGWDHVRWHDRLARMDDREAREEFERGLLGVAAALGRRPEGSAAPGWQCTAASLRIQDDLGLEYHSDTRGTCPYLPCAREESFRAPEIPTTLPTLDEVLGTVEAHREGLVPFFDRRLVEGRLNVLTVHAETEGMAHTAFLEGLLRRWRGRGVAFVRLRDVARRAAEPGASPLPRAVVVWGDLPGRAGRVACQGPAR
ncbi:MAG: 4-deoxy-4-formamido-L-arabinose-phosphoundecaprenol deformylase [Acidobacteriia bacterium]|nr:4-deoxy-4-formamido-L-arabinose-phosphoundecaprenol deformylase [Terriglobia bacterium]